jgi:transposase
LKNCPFGAFSCKPIKNDMKNKLVKGAHLSEEQCTEIVRLFCEDLTATQIAEATGVSRITVNNYLKSIRQYFVQTDLKHAETTEPTGFYALYQSNGQYHAMPIAVSDKKSAQSWLDEQFETDAVVDLLHYRLIGKIQHRMNQEDKQKKESFVSWLKNRLTKFRGINKKTMHLHMQESIFRYNNRTANLFEFIKTAMEQKPLQFK